MAIEQSERIRAALLRAKANRQSSNSPTLASAEEPAPAHSSADLSETIEPPVLEAESVSAEPSFTEAAEETESETSSYEPLEDVETVLPVVAASEEERAALFHDDHVDVTPAEAAEPSQRTLEDELPTPRTSIEAWETRKPNPLPRNILIIGGLVVLAGLSLFLLRGRLWPQSKAGSSFPLQMQVESQGNGILNVRWNPQSAAVMQAREGRLVIAERDQQTRTIALSPEQLKIGHLYYQSPVERVEFRLEIVDRSGAVAKESVLALSSVANAAEPSVGPPVAPSPDQPATESAKTKKSPPAEPQPESLPVANVAATAKTAQTEQPSRQPIRSFAPPPSQRKTEDPRAVLLEDAPPVVAGGSAVPSPVTLPEAAVRIPAPQPKPSAAPPALKTGGDLQAPKLLKRVTPVYPATAQAANIQGKVRFTATIGKDGTIQNVQAVSGPPVLIPAATEAVKKWIYEPMKLNGEPTEVVTQIEVNFALRQ